MKRKPAGAVFLLTLAAAAGAAACGHAARDLAREAAVNTDEPAQSNAPDGAGVANLPFSRGRSFGRLDDYLAYLRTLGPQDVPYYLELRPGVYEQITLRPPGEAPRIFTRQQLLEKFGFKD